MKREIIAVDVDLTVVDEVYYNWLEWYENLTGEKLENVTSENNNVEELMHKHNDPLSYWRKPDLYDGLNPIKESVESLTILQEKYDIVFVSACMPEHENSKKMFLKKHFKFPHGFVSTSDKHFVTCHYLIDDYKKYVLQVLENGPLIKKVYQMKTEINSPCGHFYGGWKEITEDLIKN